MSRATKFHAALLLPNGEVTGRECRDRDVMALNAVNQRMMAKFKRLLCEHLGDDPVVQGKFLTQMELFRGILEWQQVDPLSAMGKFLVRDQIVAASFYLHGFVPEIDEAVLEATEALFHRWFGQQAEAVCRGLRSIRERPVVIVLPASRQVLHPADWQLIGNMCPCFAAVFFERAEMAIQEIDKFCHAMGFRKGGSETDHHWN